MSNYHCMNWFYWHCFDSLTPESVDFIESADWDDLREFGTFPNVERVNTFIRECILDVREEVKN